MSVENDSGHSSSLDSSQSANERYHESLCGSILLPLPTKSSSEIFAYLRHAKFDRFQRCVNVYHKELIHMKNEREQTILHILTIHAYSYQWMRLLLMRECDPCSQDHDGYTPVHYAIERDDLETLKALTTKFYSKVKIFPDEKIIAIHENCLKALNIRQKQGLTGFMLACYHQSMKCLNYLLELHINDAHLQDNDGDTCLHYAVSRRNENLVGTLLNQCQANVNGGDSSRPSTLDVVQFNREQQRSYERNIDDSLEEILLSHHALNRSQISRTMNKLKRSNDSEESTDIDRTYPTVDSRIRTARNYARLALVSKKNGDISTSQEYYQRAMNTIPNDTLDWADYAFEIATIHMVGGENQIALDLLQQTLIIRNQFENQTDEIEKIQHAINHIQTQKSNEI